MHELDILLRSLPNNWEAKVVEIQETKDITKLLLEDLIGLLMIHEITVKEHLEDVSNKKKDISLKSTSTEVEFDDEFEFNEEELVYLNRKFKNHFEKKHFTRRSSNQKSKGEKRQVKYNCPLFKSSSKK
ncbi:uncharacterized protein LOC111025706 [Momordica charantia]|uniref:Uncharacterized protein LOC111025706 n=1 Tax=Momordica charantia TaxID=3673 RepID=A0A6J1E3H1_MOMCH|nr:uncharacterized protein LOC111025706 [Momordica charantia]